MSHLSSIRVLLPTGAVRKTHRIAGIKEGMKGQKMNHVTQNPMELFQGEAPEVAAAFDGLIRSLVGRKGIDQKTKQLIYIALKAALGDDMAVRAHIPMAHAEGASREEVIDAILMTLTVSGIRGVVHCLPLVVEHYGEE